MHCYSLNAKYSATEGSRKKPGICWYPTERTIIREIKVAPRRVFF